MNPKQNEWLAMEHVADLRREAASRRRTAIATAATPDRRGRRSTLAMSRAVLQNAIRWAFRAVHLVSPGGRPVS